MIVDTTKSIVYLVHDDGTHIALDGLTGQRRYVYYDHVRYFAETPAREWEIREFEKKGASTTFGAGRFGRLSWIGHEDPRRGDESTAYGFHSHRSFEKMLNDKLERTKNDPTGSGNRSMGCILVSEDDLSLIQKTWELNDSVLKVSTRREVDASAIASEVAPDNSNPPSWLGWLGGQND